MKSDTQIITRLKKKNSLINLFLFCIARLIWG
jgi:hypothetical protein